MKVNTKNVLKSVALAGALTAAGAATTTTAHADTNAPASDASQQSHQVSAQDQLTNLKQSQTTAENQMAASNAAEMSAATEDTNSQVAKLNDQLKQQQASQAAQDAPKLASETKKINAAASEATVKENAAYSSAVSSQQAANSSALADAQKNIYTPAQKTSLANSAQSAYQKQQAALDQNHQGKLASLKNDHDRQAKAINDQIRANETQSQRDHDQAVNNAQAKVRQASDAVTTAQNKVNADQTSVNNAQSALDQAKSALTTAQNELKAHQSGQGNINYDNYPKIYVHYDNNGRVKFNFSREGAANWKDTDPNDVNRHVQVNADGTLAQDTAKEISIFIVNTLNHMRSQLGTTLLKVNPSSLNTARQYMKMYDAKYGAGYENGIPHDYSLYNQIKSEDNLSSFGESNIDGDTPSATTTIADYKNAIYEELVEFLTNDGDSGNGHQKMLLGLGNNSWDHLANPYFAFDASDHNIDRYFIMGFNAPQTADFSLTGSTASSNLSSYQRAVENAQANVNSKAQALNAAKAQLATDQAALKDAKTALTKAQNGTSSNTDNTESPAVKQLKAQLAQLDADYAAKVKDENASYAKQSVDLKNQLNKKLTDIKALPENTTELEKTLNAKLDQLKKDHEAKLAQITKDAQAKLQAYKQQLADSHASENKGLLDQINALETALANKQAALDAKLAALKANNAAAYAALQNKLFPKASANVITGNGNSYVTGNGVTVSLPGNREHQAALPQTGNENSLMAIALGAMTALLGLGVAKKREA